MYVVRKGLSVFSYSRSSRSRRAKHELWYLPGQLKF